MHVKTEGKEAPLRVESQVEIWVVQMAECIVGHAIHVFINRSLRTLRVVLKQLCTGKVSSTSHAPSQVLVANNFVVVKF